jgi:hypothetical protein
VAKPSDQLSQPKAHPFLAEVNSSAAAYPYGFTLLRLRTDHDRPASVVTASSPEVEATIQTLSEAKAGVKIGDPRPW